MGKACVRRRLAGRGVALPRNLGTWRSIPQWRVTRTRTRTRTARRQGVAAGAIGKSNARAPLAADWWVVCAACRRRAARRGAADRCAAAVQRSACVRTGFVPCPRDVPPLLFGHRSRTRTVHAIKLCSCGDACNATEFQNTAPPCLPHPGVGLVCLVAVPYVGVVLLPAGLPPLLHHQLAAGNC